MNKVDAAEEFSNWKTNAGVLYDYVATHVLEWPTLTAQWMPCSFNSDDPIENGELTQSMLVGTFAGGEEQNSLMIVDVTLPTQPIPANNRVYQTNTDYGGFPYPGADRKFLVRAELQHAGEPNRARCMPQKPQVVATINSEGCVALFDTTKPTSNSGDDAVSHLRAHTAEGWGVAWSPLVEGRLASVADDMQLCIWDVSGGHSSSSEPATATMTPVSSYTYHKKPCQDVVWHHSAESVLFTVADDMYLCMWDTRDHPGRGPRHAVAASDSAVNCVAACETRTYLVATGGVGQDVVLWDVRRMSCPLHKMIGHEGAISSLAFNARSENLLASGAADGRVIIWDMGQIGAEQNAEDAEDGPPELMFSHGGHLSSVTEIDWNPRDESHTMLMSTTDDNNLQLWQLSAGMFLADEDEFKLPLDIPDSEVE